MCFLYCSLFCVLFGFSHPGRCRAGRPTPWIWLGFAFARRTPSCCSSPTQASLHKSQRWLIDHPQTPSAQNTEHSEQRETQNSPKKTEQNKLGDRGFWQSVTFQRVLAKVPTHTVYLSQSQNPRSPGRRSPRTSTQVYFVLVVLPVLLSACIMFVACVSRSCHLNTSCLLCVSPWCCVCVGFSFICPGCLRLFVPTCLFPAVRLFPSVSSCCSVVFFALVLVLQGFSG